MIEHAERDPGQCPHCGSALDMHGSEPGLTPYWVCPTCDPLVVILPPRNVNHATALIRVHIIDLFDNDPMLDQFDADRPDPARFVDRVCDRLAMKQETIEEQERVRRLEATGRVTDPHTQTDLGAWSA